MEPSPEVLGYSNPEATLLKPMNVLLIERDELIAELLATALAEEGIEAAILDDDRQALQLCEPNVPQVVITSINRLGEDMAGWRLVQTMRRRCPLVGAIYMAAVWPSRLCRCALGLRERFLPKTFPLRQLMGKVRELLPA
jgi:DNA-binding response OmpR family regulator